MGDLLSVLGLAGVAGAKAQTANLEGQQMKREREQKDLLAELERNTQAEDRALRQRLTNAQIAEIDARRVSRETGQGVAAPTYGTGLHEVYDPATKKRMLVQASSAGGVRPIDYEPPPEVEGRRNTDPLSDEGIKRSIEKERRMAEVRAEMGDRSIARPTESQEKSYMFGGFMKNAMPMIDALSESRNVDSRRISAALSDVVQFGERVTGPGTVQNVVLNDEEEQLLNAARMFTAGLLRKESGAAVTPSELRDTFARFIPLGGDSPALRAQKLANRKEAERMMGDLSMPARSYYARERQGRGTTPLEQPPAGPADITPFLPPRRTP